MSSANKLHRAPGFVTVEDFGTATRVVGDAHFVAPDMISHLRALERETGIELGAVIRAAHNAPFFLSGPRHARARSAITRQLGANRLRMWRPVIRDIVDDCASILAQAARPDLILDFARPVSSRISQRLFGLCPALPNVLDDGAPQFQQVLAPLLPLRRILAIQDAVHAMMEQIREQDCSNHPSEPTPLLAALRADPPEGFDDDDLIALVLVLYGASLNIGQTLGNMLLELLRGPAELRLSAADPSWLQANLEGLIRRNASPKYIYRIATRPKAVKTCSFVPGDNVLIDLRAIHDGSGAACSGDAAPVRRRSGEPLHLAFGRGLHRCVGASLGRLVISTAIPALFQHLPGLRRGEQEPELDASSEAITLRSLPCLITHPHNQSLRGGPKQ